MKNKKLKAEREELKKEASLEYRGANPDKRESYHINWVDRFYWYWARM